MPSPIQKIATLAQQYLGTPYQWGGASPKSGFDCSGFVQWLYGQQGIKIPRTTYQQVKAGAAVAKSQLKPGDILFFEPTKQGPGHEGLYLGNGKFIEAPHTGATIRISLLAGRKDYVTARRIIKSGSPSIDAVASSAQPPPQTTDQAMAPFDVQGVAPPNAVPPPTALGVPGPEVSLPGSVDYTVDPHNEQASLWGQVAQGDLVSPETQAMVRNAQLSSGV